MMDDKLIIYNSSDLAFSENGEIRFKRKYGKFERKPIHIHSPETSSPLKGMSMDGLKIEVLKDDVT